MIHDNRRGGGYVTYLGNISNLTYRVRRLNMLYTENYTESYRRIETFLGRWVLVTTYTN